MNDSSDDIGARQGTGVRVQVGARSKAGVFCSQAVLRRPSGEPDLKGGEAILLRCQGVRVQAELSVSRTWLSEGPTLY